MKNTMVNTSKEHKNTKKTTKKLEQGPQRTITHIGDHEKKTTISTLD
jgi:hypothetical protein